MTIKWKTGETTWFCLPRYEDDLIRFLIREGFKPKRDTIEDSVVHVNKELIKHRLDDKWNKFTGYDKILKALNIET